MRVRFKLCSAVLVCVMIALSVIGCAEPGQKEDSRLTDATEISESNSEATDPSDEEKEPDMQDVWTDIHTKATGGEGIKVLFVGDSLTYYNDMSLIFQAFSRAAGKKVRVASYTKGGMGIAMMRDDAAVWGQISDKIASDDWDIVVLQPQRNQTVMGEFFPNYPWEEYSAAKDLVEMIRGAGALPLLYSTFGVTKGYVTRDGFTKRMTREEHTELITEYNAALSELLDCKAVYAGETFRAAYEKDPSINLYDADRSHPCEAGSYLVAADFYTVIFGESAKGVEYSGSLDAQTAAFLREQSDLLLQFTPSKKAQIKEYASSENFSLSFGAHGFSDIAPSGSSKVLSVLSDDHVQYVYRSGQGILSSFAKLDGSDLIGDVISAEMKLSFGKYSGSYNPSGGFILATEDGQMIRMYARTNASDVVGEDCTGADFEVRVDIDTKNSVVLGSYDSELTMKVTADSKSLSLYVNGLLFATMTESGAVFYDGTTSSELKYSGQRLHVGLLFCYADVDFSDIVITAVPKE